MDKILLKNIPKIDIFVDNFCTKENEDKYGRKYIVEIIRKTIEEIRESILKEKINTIPKIEEINKIILTKLENNNTRSLKKVFNLTGTVLHTNLGRAPMSAYAVENLVQVATNYSNLEYDIDKGERGSRYTHIERLINSITKSEASLVVNNNAAAVLIILNTFAKDKNVVVSRGEEVEIGGSFRIPEIMRYSNTELIEVGTTNKTHKEDYENAINEETALILKVHTSNFKILGFTEDVSLTDLKQISINKNVPLYFDIGSGAFNKLKSINYFDEITVEDAIEKGVDIISFSGDKLLGGSQAGIIAGKKCFIDKIKQNQLLRALRIDKLTLTTLEGTLLNYINFSTPTKGDSSIPILNMLSKTNEEIRTTAFKYFSEIKKEYGEHTNKNLIIFDTLESTSSVGGGAMPAVELYSYGVSIASEKIKTQVIEETLRKQKTPIITRVVNDKVFLDFRTLIDTENNFVKLLIEKLVDLENKS